MDFQTVFNIGLGFVFTLMGWFARELWGAVKELRVDLAELRAELPKDYVSKNDYRVDIARVHDLLDKIYEMLSKKADK